MKTMTPRERVLTALRRQVPDKVPREISYGAFTPALMRIFQSKTGADDPAEYFNFEVRAVKFAPLEEDLRARFARYLPPDLPAGAVVDDWGVARIQGDFLHFTRRIHPMRDFASAEAVESYPFPDFSDPQRHAHLRPEVAALHARGLAAMGELYATIFEVAWSMRGMENLLTDFLLNPDLAAALLDRVTEIRCTQARLFVQAGVDILRLGDDVAQQRGLLMRPETWRGWLKPRLAKVIQAAREVNPNVLIFYHCDGNVEQLVPELIEIGVDILNPVQPECMDPVKIKRLYGDRLSFWGTIGTQSVMPFGTPQDVKATVRHMIETVGEGGGLLLAPTHILEPEVPWDNILAFFEAIEEYGYYR